MSKADNEGRIGADELRKMQIAASDENGTQRLVLIDANGILQMEQLLAYVAAFDAHKVMSAGQTHLDLIPTTFSLPGNTQQTVGAGSNYDLSATGGWILHPDIKRAKAIQVFGNFSQATEVKLYSAPIDSPDQNTPEYVWRGNGSTEWMFQEANGNPFAMGAPASSRILPFSGNALKFYVKNEHATIAESLSLYIRLIF